MSETSKTSQNVQEFRSIVERVISLHVSKAQQGPLRRSWLGMDTEAKAAGLTFVSVEPKGGRSHVIGLGPEHKWAVMTDQLRYAGYVGHLAIISIKSETDSLTRHWSFKHPLSNILAIDTKRQLDKEEIELAVEWARSPHLMPGALERFATLTQEEQSSVQDKMEVALAQRQKLNEDLEAISRARRAAIPNLRIN